VLVVSADADSGDHDGKTETETGGTRGYQQASAIQGYARHESPMGSDKPQPRQANAADDGSYVEIDTAPPGKVVTSVAVSGSRPSSGR
jgi:hypothetical protein